MVRTNVGYVGGGGAEVVAVPGGANATDGVIGPEDPGMAELRVGIRLVYPSWIAR